MKISILTPAFNSAKYLERAIRSVMAQDYDDWEHVVVDGASTDGTVEILKKYPHVKWVSEPDKGIYDAMNKGIKMTSGEWIYFMGADDRLRPGILKKIAEKAEDSEAEIIYGNVWSIRFGGRYDGKFDYKKIYEKNICHQAIFFDRKVFDKIGFFNPRYRSHADWDHNLRWLLNGKINYEYIDCIIADYADGGFSSKHKDTLFQRDKRYNYILYGWKNVPKDYIKSLCVAEIKSKDSWFYRKLVVAAIGVYVKYF